MGVARLRTKIMSERESHYSSFLSCTPTIKELTEHVDVGSNWYIVGTMLDLDQRRLRSIEGQTGHTDTHKTIEMFNLWLTTTPTASRREILEVLRKRVVGENTVADEYEKHLKELHESTCKLTLTVCPLILVTVIIVNVQQTWIKVFGQFGKKLLFLL